MGPRNFNEDALGLTVLEKKAVRHYIENGSKIGAFVHAYGPQKCKKMTLQAKVRRFWARPNVLAEVRRVQAQLCEQVELTAADLVRRWAQLGYTDLADIVDWDGERVTVRPFDDLTVAERAALKKIEVDFFEPRELVDVGAVVGDDDEGMLERLDEVLKAIHRSRPIKRLSVEMHDANGALTSIAKKMGLFEKRKANTAELPVININLPSSMTIEPPVKAKGRK